MTNARRSAATTTAEPEPYVGTDIARAELSTPHVPAWIITALGVVGIVVLAAMGKPIPEALTTMIGLSGGAAAGLSLPRSS